VVLFIETFHSFLHSIFCLTTGPKPPPKRCLHIVRSRASYRLAHATSALLRYFSKWKLQVNVHKTEAILFTRRRPTTPRPLCLNLFDIPWNPHVRYLGLVLDRKLLFTRHITSITHKASGTLLQLFPLLARDSILALSNKLILF